MTKKCIIICGMHRCGTSALAGSLNSIGWNIGNKVLLSNDKFNEKGYFENESILTLNKSTLFFAGSSWYSADLSTDTIINKNDSDLIDSTLKNIIKFEYEDSDQIVIKDPRISFLLPYYISALSDLNYESKIVICFRHPNEVAASLSKRNHFEKQLSTILYSNYIISAEENSRQHARYFSSYNNLLSNPTKVIAEIIEEWNIELDSNALSSIAKSIDHSLHHNVYDSIETSHTIESKVFSKLSKLDKNNGLYNINEFDTFKVELKKSIHAKNKRKSDKKSKESSNSQLFAQLYIDTGSGYNESDTQVIDISKNKRNLIFELSQIKNLVKLRFDPVNDYCLINIVRIQLQFEDGSFVEADFSGNYKSKINTTYLFETIDPTLNIDLHNVNKQIKSLNAEVDYIAIGPDSTSAYSIIVEENELLKLENGRLNSEKEIVEKKILNVDVLLQHIKNQYDDTIFKSDRLILSKNKTIAKLSEEQLTAIQNMAAISKNANVSFNERADLIINSFKESTASIQSDLSTIMQLINNKSEIIRIKEDKIASQHKTLTSLESDKTKLQDQLTMLRKQLEEKEVQIGEAKILLKQKSDELTNTKELLQSRMQDIAVLNEEKRLLAQKVNELNKIVYDKEVHIQNIENFNKEYQAEIVVLSNEINKNANREKDLINQFQLYSDKVFSTKRFKLGQMLLAPFKLFNKQYDQIEFVIPTASISSIKSNSNNNITENSNDPQSGLITDDSPPLHGHSQDPIMDIGLILELDSANILNNEWISISGWALAKTDDIQITLSTNDDVFLKDCIYGIHRPDVGALKENEYQNAHQSGFSALYKIGEQESISEIKVTVTDGDGNKIAKLRELIASDNYTVLDKDSQYQMYIENNTLSNDDILLLEKEISEFKYNPVISIVVPVYNVDPKWLDLCIDSVKKQLYPNWELCLHDDKSTAVETINCLKKWSKDDPRIKVSFGNTNGNISVATNSAIALATGEFVSLLDNDDELTIDALYWVVKTLNENHNLDLIYSDEDKLEMNGQRSGPYFKSDFNIDLLRANNYICHFTTIRKSIGDSFGWFEQGVEGSQDHDVILKTVDNTSIDRIFHIPKILYHWRKIPGSTAASYGDKSYAFDAGKKALENHLKRNKLKGNVIKSNRGGIYRILYDYNEEELISIIIPFKDEVSLLKDCIISIMDNTVYKNYEILLISNNSIEQDTFTYCENLVKKHDNIKFFEYNIPFNYSAINNWAAKKAGGSYLLFLNNDVQVITPSWLIELARFGQRSDVGAVGARLVYDDMTIQHAGIAIGVSGVAGHVFKHLQKDIIHHFTYGIERNVSACTAACLLVRTSVFHKIKGFDEDNFKVAFNDVDLCLKIRETGALIVYTPYCELIHFESKTRGFEDTPEKKARFQKEIDAFNKKWKRKYKNDQYYNPNLSKSTTNYDINI